MSALGRQKIAPAFSALPPSLVVVSEHYKLNNQPLNRALHHAEKRKIFSDEGERCLSVASLRAAENFEHSKHKVMLAQMVLGTFAETKVPRPWVREPSDRIKIQLLIGAICSD